MTERAEDNRGRHRQGGSVMALVWQCDRCDSTSNSGDVDDPPEDWERRSLPIRGSEGARSSMDAVICRDCDDSLYKWFRSGDIDQGGAFCG